MKKKNDQHQDYRRNRFLRNILPALVCLLLSIVIWLAANYAGSSENAKELNFGFQDCREEQTL